MTGGPATREPHGAGPPASGATATRSDLTTTNGAWFHRPFRADDWLHYDPESTWAGGGRALCRGLPFDRAGVLVASVMQEAPIRRVDRSTP
jgi:acyl-CoA thioesterase-2